MGFRFRKSVKLGKKVRLNIGKRSVGISAGGRRGGISINSRSGTRARASIPGTGMSYSTKLSGGKTRRATSSISKKTRISMGHRDRKPLKTSTSQRKALNPVKPPKSPKVYFICGIVLLPIGFLLLLLFWPLGLFSIGMGIYYIACGPKLYADLVVKYKTVHPDFEENI